MLEEIRNIFSYIDTFYTFYYSILVQKIEYCRQVSLLKSDIMMKGFENHQ